MGLSADGLVGDLTWASFGFEFTVKGPGGVWGGGVGSSVALCLAGSYAKVYVTDSYGNEGILTVYGIGGGLDSSIANYGIQGFYSGDMDKIWELEGFSGALTLTIGPVGGSMTGAEKGKTAYGASLGGSTSGASFTATITYSTLTVTKEVVR